jgi:MFS family permease
VVVTSSGGINAQGIRPLYYLRFVITITVFLFMAVKLKTPSTITAKRKESSEEERVGFVQGFRDFFRGERWLKRWVILRIVRAFVLRIAGPFGALWLVDVKGATPYILGVMGTIGIVISVFTPIIAGRLADQLGRKKAFYVLRPIGYLSTLLVIVAPRPEYLILSSVVGSIGGASFIPFVTMHWELVPQEKRGRWYSIESFINIFSLPAPLLGGYLWQHGFMVEVLLLPIVLEVLLFLPIFITVPDTLGRRKHETNSN